MQAQQFEDFLDTVCSGIFSDRVRRRTRKELLDHLTCKAEDAVAEGRTESDAVAAALQCFGETGVVRAQITRAHRKDNLKTLGKGFGRFLLSLLATAFGLLMQIIILFFSFSFADGVGIFLIGILFVVLTGMSLYAARRKQIMLPIYLIPAALAQILFAIDHVPSFLITLPELVAGRLPAFFEDIAYGEAVATPLSIGIMIGYILLYTATNLWISISSFRLRSKRSKTMENHKWAVRVSAGLLTVTVAAVVLCFGIGFVPNRIDQTQYVSHYVIVPADTDAEVQEILQYYRDNGVQFDHYFSDKTMYPTEETAYWVSYHHDLDSAGIEAAAYRDRQVNPNDDTILDVSGFRLFSRDLFYEAYRSVVVLAPEKPTGYYVAVPVIDGYAQPDDAKLIALPLEKDAVIYGNMNLDVYEIILKQPEAKP